MSGEYTSLSRFELWISRM